MYFVISERWSKLYHFHHCKYFQYSYRHFHLRFSHSGRLIKAKFKIFSKAYMSLPSSFIIYVKHHNKTTNIFKSNTFYTVPAFVKFIHKSWSPGPWARWPAVTRWPRRGDHCYSSRLYMNTLPVYPRIPPGGSTCPAIKYYIFHYIEM